MASRIAFNSTSGDDSHRILPPERIGHSQGAFGIISPLAVHQKTVVMIAGLQVNGRTPDTVGVLLQAYGFLLPIREVSH